MSLNTTAATWVTGTVVTAAQLNLEVRDAINGMQAAWTAYTPTWTGTGTNPVVGNGVLLGAYSRVGKSLTVRISVIAGTTTTFGTGNYLFAMPFAPVAAIATWDALGACTIVDDSAATRYGFSTFYGGSNTVAGVSATGTRLAQTIPMTWANLDRASMLFQYEAA